MSAPTLCSVVLDAVPTFLPVGVSLPLGIPGVTGEKEDSCQCPTLQEQAGSEKTGGRAPLYSSGPVTLLNTPPYTHLSLCVFVYSLAIAILI